MNIHNFLHLIERFSSTSHKFGEKRFLKMGGRGEGPGGATAEEPEHPPARESRDRALEAEATERQGAQDATAEALPKETEGTKIDIEIAKLKDEKIREPAKQKIFDKYTKTETISTLDHKQVQALLEFCKDSKAQENNFSKIKTLISGGTLKAKDINATSKKILTDYFSSQSGGKGMVEVVNSLMDKDNTKEIQEWMIALKGKKVPMAESLIFGEIYKSSAFQKINESAISSIIETLGVEAGLNYLSAEQKLIALNGKDTSIENKGKILSDIFANHFDKLNTTSIEGIITLCYVEPFKSSHLKALEEKLTPEIIKTLKTFGVVNFLLVTLSKDEESQGFFNKILNHCSDAIKEALVAHNSTNVNGDYEKILLALNPSIEEAIKTFKLQIVNGKYKKQRPSRDSQLWFDGYFTFEAKNQDKIIYIDTKSKTKYSTSITSPASKDNPEEWTKEEDTATVEAPIQPEKGEKAPEALKTKKYLITTVNTKLYTDDKDTKGEDIKVGTLLTIESEEPITMMEKLFIKVRIDGTEKVGFIQIDKMEKVDKIDKKDMETTHSVSMIDEEGKTIGRDIVKGDRVKIIIPYTRTINGNKCVKVFYHRYNKEGWVDQSFLKEYTPSAADRKMAEGDGSLKSLHEKYFIDFDAVEATDREITTGKYQIKLGKTPKMYFEGLVHAREEDRQFFEVKEPKILKLTKKGEYPVYVVKIEDFGHLDYTDQTVKSSEGIPAGYINIKDIIAGHDINQKSNTASPELTKSEWSKEPSYDKTITLKKEKYGLKKNTSLYGYDEKNPHLFQNFSEKTSEVQILDEKVRIIEGEKYANVQIINKETNEAGLKGWAKLSDINIPKLEITRFDTRKPKAEASPKLDEAQTAIRAKVFTPSKGDTSGLSGTISFKTGEKGQIDRDLEAKTKLTTIFPAKDGDKVIITRKGKKLEAIYDAGKDKFFYTDRKGRMTTKEVILAQDDELKFMPREASIERKEEIRGKVYDPETGLITFENKTQELKTRLRDIFPAKDGDKVIITKKGTKTPKIAIYIAKKDNFYFIDQSEKILGRALIFNGDKVWFEPKIGREKPVASPLDVIGTYKPKEGQSASEIVKEIYSKHPGLQKQVRAAGLSDEDYYEKLRQTYNEDTGELSVIWPKEDTMLGYREQASERARSYEAQQAQRGREILTKSDAYIGKEVFFKGKMKEYLDNDAKWNNLWDRTEKDETQDEYIAGIERVIGILKSPPFSLTKEKVRTALLEMVQMWLNEKVDFEDAFNYFSGQGKIKYQYIDDDGDTEDGDYKDLGVEINKCKVRMKRLSPADLEKISRHYDKIDQITVDLEAARAQGREAQFLKSDLYRAYQSDEKATEKIRNIYIKEYKPASQRLEYLNKNILKPLADLLDALALCQVVSSTKESFFDKTEAALVQVGTTADKIPEKTTFYNLEDLVEKKQGSPKQMTEVKEGNYIITTTENVEKQFTQLIEKHGLDKANFDRPTWLKLVFRIYSIETLISKGCLQRLPDNPQKLALTKLPEELMSDDPKVKQIFEKIKTGKDIDEKPELFDAETVLDQNTFVVNKLLKIFAKHAGDEVAWSGGSEVDGPELTMEGIAIGEATKLTKDELRKYMSENAARSEILRAVTVMEKGVEIYSKGKLSQELNKRAATGLAFIELSTFQNPELTKFRARMKSETPASLQAKIAKFLASPEGELDKDVRTLIRLGHLKQRIIDEGKESEKLKFSEVPEIKRLQQAMMEADQGFTQEDLDKVEEIMALGIGVSIGSDGSFGGIGVGFPIELGKGWRITPSVGVGPGGIAAGVSVDKFFALSKDGRESIFVGVDAGFLYLGVHGGATWRLPAKGWKMGVGGAVGVCVLGLYAGGALFFKKDTKVEQKELYAEQLETLGFTKVDALIAKKASEAKIMQEIYKLPGIGPEFQKAHEKGISYSILLKFYIESKDAIESNVTQNLGTGGNKFDIVGGGVWAGTISGIPLVGAYVTLKIGEMLTTLRSLPKEYAHLEAHNDALITSKTIEELQKQEGSQFLTLEHNGEMSIDSATGQPIMLQNRKETDLGKVSGGLDKYNQALGKIDMGMTEDASTGLKRLSIGKVKGNLKILVDPKLKEQLVIKGNQILIDLGGETSNLIFTREEFMYPFKASGESQLTVITIKDNPYISRSAIERESVSIVYKRAGAEYRPDIVPGAGSEGDKKSTTILNWEAYQAQVDKPASKKGISLEKHKQYFDTMREAGVITEATEIREGIVSRKEGEKSFSSTFYKRFHKKYKRLSTIGAGADTEALTAEIQKEFEKYHKAEKMPGEATLSTSELQLVLNDLMTKGFTEIEGKADRQAAMESNLEFCRGILTKFFRETIKKLDTKGIKIKRPPELLAGYIIEELKRTDIDGEKTMDLTKSMRVLAVVGTEGIKGMRGVLSYKQESKYGILHPQFYQPKPEGSISSEIWHVITELLSPLETVDDKAFMESPLTMKMATHPGIFFIMGEDDALKLAQCFKTKSVAPENKDAFEKFKKLVIEIREAQKQGANFKILDNGVRISFKTEVGAGVYKKCGNSTLFFQEDIIVLVPYAAGPIAIGNIRYVSVNSKTHRADITVTLGVQMTMLESKGGETEVDSEPVGEVDAKIGGKGKGSGDSDLGGGTGGGGPMGDGSVSE